MFYVNKKMVLVINKMVIELSGGSATVGNNIRLGQNLSFIDHIYNNSIFGMAIYSDIFHQAAAYMFYIIKNHIFWDGNKRTGLATAITFLEWNKILFSPFDEDKVFEFVMSVAQGENDPEALLPVIASWLKDMSIH
ncbi:type II toxin-antitoxin system death-on-curing family toxin [candidate division CSSED10-310 bacterium]|uniref:Type II toxin-antitoxin system death-on-curing family toxin n=1 Tax=candidate division CSSED10-310 bacterium TaxID=2855610 RepID=A0ABV6YZ37_UNCC1